MTAEVVPATRKATLGRWAAALSVAAGFIHLVAFSEHLREWWAEGVFFLLAAAVQVLYAILLVTQPWKPGSYTTRRYDPVRLERRFYAAGLAGNLLLILFYLETRTLGIPLGPEAGTVEPWTGLGVLSKLTEGWLVVVLWRLLSVQRSSK